MHDNIDNKIVFRPTDENIELEIKLENETVWLSQRQMSELFSKDSDTIGLHIKNIYESGELLEASTTEQYSVVQKEGKRNVTRSIIFYNLDMIISVGYRVNSKRGTQFRIWATNILRQYLVEGYALNQQRLESAEEKYQQLNAQIKTLRKVVENETFTLEQSKELIKIIADYTDALELIDQVDHQVLKIPAKLTVTEAKRIDYNEAIENINKLRSELALHELFGNEKDNGFKSALKSIFQTFGGKDLYPSVEEKAANLLYLIIKNHPFTDGNKRIGSFMFVRFLDLNSLLYRDNGTKLVEENALVAIALLIAQSDPVQKELMVRLVVNLIKG